MNGAVLLMYHRLGEGRLTGRETGEHRYALKPALFEAHLETLRESRCTVLPLPAFRAAGEALPHRSVSITFDDGNASDHTVALPALARRGITAAFFITPAWVGAAGYLDWPDVRELAAAGMTVGAHGLDHTLLPGLGDEALRANLREARSLMEARMGRAPSWLSLPGGRGGQREVSAAREVGFEYVLGSVPQLARPGYPDPIPRFAVRCGDSLARFRALVEQRPSERLRHLLRHRTLLIVRPLLSAKVRERLGTV